MAENVSKIFHDEVRDKKRTGYGAYHRASRKKGFKGGVRMPYDMMTTKEKRALNKQIKEGMVIYKMYDKIDRIMDKDKFYDIEDNNEKADIMSQYLKKFGFKTLCKEWDMKDGAMSSLIYRLNLNRSGEFKEKPQVKQKVVEVAKKSVSKEVAIDKCEDTIATPKKPSRKSIQYQRLNGEFEGEECMERILNMINSLVGNRKYTVNLEIEEYEEY